MKCRCCFNLLNNIRCEGYFLSNHPYKIHHNHRGYDSFGMNRKYWEVIDLDLWFESDLTKGCVPVVHHMRRNSKYSFKIERSFL